MKIKIEPIFEDGEVIGRDPRIEGWSMTANNETVLFPTRIDALKSAALAAGFTMGPVTIEVVH